MTKATQRVAEAVNDMLRRNERTRGAVASRKMYLGDDILVVPLARPVVIEGQWENVERTADIFDLMDAYREEMAERGRD